MCIRDRDYDLIISKCNTINGHFLITGKGSINLFDKKEEISVDKLLEEKSYTIEIQKKYIKTLENQLNKSKPYPEVPIIIHGVAAVSYTHLDVYKRQTSEPAHL